MAVIDTLAHRGCRARGPTYGFSQEEMVVFGLDAQVLEDGIGPESLHVVPVLNLAMADRVMKSVACFPGELKFVPSRRYAD